MAMDDAGLGVAAVGGDTGGDVGAGGGDFSGGDGFEPEVPAGDEGTEGGEGTGDSSGVESQEFETDPETGEAKLDAEGNPIPKSAAPADFKTTHSKLKAMDAKAAETYRKTHFANEQYKKSFETPQAAMEAKELFESYGGAEGIEQIHGRAEQFAKEMDGFSKNDPNFYKQLHADDPQGFERGASTYLKELSTNAEAYNAALTPILNTTLEQSGITPGIIEAGNILDAVYGELKSAGNTAQLPAIAQAFKVLQKAFGATENFKKLAEKSGERPLSDREKQLNDREAKIQKETQDRYVNEVQTKVTQASDTAIDKALSPYYKQVANLTKDQKQDLHDGVFSYVSQQLKSNAKYGKQLRTLLDAGDQAKVVNFVQQNVNKLLQNGAAKTVWNRRGFGKLPNAGTKGGNTGGAQGGVVKLSSKPKHSDIDFSKDPSEMEYMAGRATLKSSGKKVTWDWSKI